MFKDLPKLSKSVSDFAPNREDLSARIRRAGAKTLVAALSLLGIQIGASASPAPAAEIAIVPVIANRKDKTERGSIVLQLASNLANQISFLGHRSHRSHSSHRSHYSSSGGSGGSSSGTVTPPKTTAPPVLAEDNSPLASAESLTGKITEVQSAKQYFVLKDNAENFHTIYFAGTTKVHLLSPSDQTSTVDTLKAFMGSIPLKVGQSIMVHWKTVEAKKTAVQITLFELPK
jgi:hypothetical protein